MRERTESTGRQRERVPPSIGTSCAPIAFWKLTMSISDPHAMPADVFYVVESTGVPGRREHRLASILYGMRPHANSELARLCAAHPGNYAVWKSTTYIEPPRWGYAVMRADGAVVPPGAFDATFGPPRGRGGSGALTR